jgi:hypothetical protein
MVATIGRWKTHQTFWKDADGAKKLHHTAVSSPPLPPPLAAPTHLAAYQYLPHNTSLILIIDKFCFLLANSTNSATGPCIMTRPVVRQRNKHTTQHNTAKQTNSQSASQQLPISRPAHPTQPLELPSTSQ